MTLPTTTTTPPQTEAEWRYEQTTGKMFLGSVLMCAGYSGAGDGKNNPTMEQVRNVGPLPVGRYTIGSPRDTANRGPYVLPLTPWKENEMYGRSAFLIHGDSIAFPGTASEGCIILARKFREQIWKSGKRNLEVYRRTA